MLCWNRFYIQLEAWLKQSMFILAVANLIRWSGLLLPHLEKIALALLLALLLAFLLALLIPLPYILYDMKMDGS